LDTLFHIVTVTASRLINAQGTDAACKPTQTIAYYQQSIIFPYT